MASIFNSVAKIKTWLNISSATDDVLIEELSEAVDQMFFDELDDNFLSQAYVEKYDGDGQSKLWLRHRPITAVSSLKINEVSVAAAPDSVSSGFLFDKDQLYLVQGTRILAVAFQFTDRFLRGQQNISVSYTAGTTAGNAPKSLISAHLRQVSFQYKERERIGVKSKTLGPDQTLTFITDDWAPGVQAVLQKRKNVIPV